MGRPGRQDGLGLCPLSRASTPLVLVAADPEWTSGGVLSTHRRTSIAGVQAGAHNLRLLNFNIFPLMACTQVVEGRWSFTLMDRVVFPFLEVTGGANTLVDIEREYLDTLCLHTSFREMEGAVRGR